MVKGVLTHCNARGIGRPPITAPPGRDLFRGRRIEAANACMFMPTKREPLLQGARLTAWELSQRGIDVTLISAIRWPPKSMRERAGCRPW